MKSTSPVFPRVRPMMGPLVYRLAFLGCILALVLPKAGLSISICQFRNVTGLPCPGCGLTRSVTSVLQLDFALAWSYNPFGYLAAIVMIILAVAAIIPAWRHVLERLTSLFDGPISVLFWLAVGSLLVFGVARLFVG